MFGPTWAARQFVKNALKENGVDTGTAMFCGYAAGFLVSLVCHDHWGHFAPDAEDVADHVSNGLRFGHELYDESNFTVSADNTYYLSTSDYVAGTNGYVEY